LQVPDAFQFRRQDQQQASALCKESAYLLFTKSNDWRHVIFTYDKCSRRLLKCDAPELKIKQVAFRSILKIFVFSARMEGKKEEGGYVLATFITL
jgi:hypothetical protein